MQLLSQGVSALDLKISNMAHKLSVRLHLSVFVLNNNNMLFLYKSYYIAELNLRLSVLLLCLFRKEDGHSCG